jgi:hypothetical protein
VLGAASCVLLATQIEAEVWLRGLLVLAVGVVLAAVAVAKRGKGAGDRTAPSVRGPAAGGDAPNT